MIIKFLTHIILFGFLTSNTPDSYLVINGNSYHHNVTEYDYCDNDCNSNNWGIGYEKHNPKTGLIYSAGTFMDSWNKFSWYGGYGGEYYINRFTNFGFSMGIMNKNYSADKQITSVYMFPYIGFYFTKALVINITVIPTSKIAKGWTAGNEWPTTLFFQYKLRITK